MTSAQALQRAIEEAARALAHRVHERDELPEEERSDAHAFALSYVTAQVGHGWRPTEAKRSTWAPTPRGDHTETYQRGAALARRWLNLKSDPDKEGYHDAGPV
ncbi:hypothetical protein SAMN05421874_12867 [Nonomuraea maritima]|uniref:Uncharacterized protein n=1 Tax=Nonomuraea maritima TaxID=683260 RepID=A0A1G9MK44_9ACTN|nr:hypothetical protein [Nonomuraea maritima]SDL74443.1 hypothetical protein SAMN05421874_12867 [Nonomuraea maritima]